MIFLCNTSRKQITLIAAFQLFFCPATLSAQQVTPAVEQETIDLVDQPDSGAQTSALNTITQSAITKQARIINDIIVKGNKYVPTEAVLDRIPYKKGEIFDAGKTHKMIRHLYDDLKRFRNISIYGENVGTDRINLHIVVEEKKMIKDIVFKGNKKLTAKEFKEKIPFAEIKALDEEELQKYAQLIKKLYIGKGYHLTTVAPELTIDEDGKAIATFNITEYRKSLVKRLSFSGNNNISAKSLRSVLYSREDWLLSFMDQSGTFQEDRVDADKHMIEQFYQNRGYLNAKVVDTKIETDPKTQNIAITYIIQEGNLYTIKEVKAPGNDIIPEENLLRVLPIKPGDIYSRQNLVDAIKGLEFIWGDLGYVYAHIEPAVESHDEDCTVDITFFSEIGTPVYLNQLTIRGNKKTRDKVIRRRISLEEGGLITNRYMEMSKNRVESLGYFDQRDGVNWKMTRISQDLADLDLIIKEAKTGSAQVKAGFGGSVQNLYSSQASFSVEVGISDTNVRGTGISTNLNATYSKDTKTILFNLSNPWLFDKPIYGGLDAYHKRIGYDELKLTIPVNEQHTGGSLTTGFATGARHNIFADSFIRFTFGINNINYATSAGFTHPRANKTLNQEAQDAYNKILSKSFEAGTFPSWMTQLGKDTKNHPMHPTTGHTWMLRSIWGLPSFNNTIAFHKFDLDMHWYTPLIGNFDLIFHARAYLGFVNQLKNKSVPYRELFHIGGLSSVRGFQFGQIGPRFVIEGDNGPISDSIGGLNTFFVNAELIFPITSDFNLKGVAFYDGGAGWNNPYVCHVPARFVRNNTFDYRHAVGFGIRMLSPMPIRIDWGFKLDTRKNELSNEVHFGMAYDF